MGALVNDEADLVDGWETLFVAALSPEKKTRGIVYLNKVLAKLQRHGFPIPIRFRNLPMGPASKDVGRRARRASKAGFLEPTRTPMGPGYRDRLDWELTEAGFRYVKEEIVPTLSALEGGHQDLQLVQKEMRELKHKSGNALKDESHEALILDDPELFAERYEELLEELGGWARFFAEEVTPRSDAELAAGAAVELALMALEEKKKEATDWFSDSTGIRHVFWNAERLTDVLEEIIDEDEIDATPWDDEREEIERLLQALERNCEYYDMPLPSEEEIEEKFWEAEPFDPEALIE